MKAAVIDAGSNSSRLNVFEFDESGDYRIVDFYRIPTALVSYVDSEHALSDEGLDILCASLDKLRERATAAQDIDFWNVFATAALREIDNSEDVLFVVSQRTGFEVDVVSGLEEATLGFESLKSRFDLEEAVLADVGGGSTELVVISGGEATYMTSLPLGCRKLSDEFPGSEQLTIDECEDMRLKVRDIVASVECESVPGCDFYGIGGTAKALHRLIGSNEPALPADLMEHAEVLCPERLDTIAAGAIIFDELWKHFQPAVFMSSNANAREGYFIKKVLPAITAQVQSR